MTDTIESLRQQLAECERERDDRLSDAKHYFEWLGEVQRKLDATQQELTSTKAGNSEYIRVLEDRVSECELLSKQSAEIEKLRQFHHDQQELHERNEALHQTNNILREQLADKHQLFMCASANYDRLAEHLVFANDQITELQRERDELVADAKRYRYIRAEIGFRNGWIAISSWDTTQWENFRTGDDLDSAIDAALAKLGADKGEK